MPPQTSSQYTARPGLVKFSGEVSEIRLSPQTHVSGYSGGTYRGSMSSWISTVGAITVRVKGKPITCLIDMRTRNIGIMPGNNVTIWGKARVWKAGSDLPDSVDVMRMTCEETGEIHPSGIRQERAVYLIPLFFCLIFGVFFVFLFFGPLSLIGGFSFFMPFLPLMLLPIAFVVIMMIVLIGMTASRRQSVGPLEGYVEVGSATNVVGVSGTSNRCIVCNLPISKADEIVYCPHCGNQAHREHMLEWLHTHDSCPVCEKHLDEKDF